MSKIWTHRKPCRLCSSRKVIPLLKFAFTPPGTSLIQPDGSALVGEKIPLIVSLCEKCHLVQMQDVVDPGLLYQTYPHIGPPTPESESHYEAYAHEAAERARLKSGDVVIDIGSGNGLLLKAFLKLGMKAIGVDPAAAAQEASKRLGALHYRDFFSPNLANDIKNDHGMAALITANYTLGAVDNLHAVSAGVRFLLKQEGVMFIEEPHLLDLLTQNEFDRIHHERLSFLTASTMDSFFRSTLLHLLDAQRIPFRSGTLRLTVQRSDGPHVVAPGLPAFLAQEKAANLHLAEPYNAFALRVETLKTKLNHLVSDFKGKGQKVAGYGASSRTTTLVHECGWNQDTLDFIIDDDPAKHGCRLAGTDIPIVSAKALSERKPGVVLLFAHHHANRLVKQLDPYRKAGGKCVTIFPAPIVV
ncbi:MAG TPA: class I SAM-dependent methyltransferase [Kiritimatiellia bacterium]|nr:class I SAM-dependent methyltransferase [Kiritimatiellia bacterium]HMO98241.1 class I SAM-dependent methyltransferase [Kiritimatiellia bacterium]